MEDIFFWQVSRILYLDSPAGVGFSYSSNESDYVTGDLKTASDSHIFLLKVPFETKNKKMYVEVIIFCIC